MVLAGGLRAPRKQGEVQGPSRQNWRPLTLQPRGHLHPSLPPTSCTELLPGVLQTLLLKQPEDHLLTPMFPCHGGEN